MLSAFLYLFLAHLIADFLLQPWELVLWKHRNWKGVALHSFIHLLVMLAVFAPFGVRSELLWVAALLAVSHFCIDTLKILFERRGRKFYKYFILDQTVHIMLLLVGAAALGEGFFGGSDAAQVLTENSLWNLYFNETVIIGACAAILFSWTFEVAVYQFQREKDPAAKFRPHRGAIIARLFVVAVLTGFAAGI